MKSPNIEQPDSAAGLLLGTSSFTADGWQGSSTHLACGRALPLLLRHAIQDRRNRQHIITKGLCRVAGPKNLYPPRLFSAPRVVLPQPRGECLGVSVKGLPGQPIG